MFIDCVLKTDSFVAYVAFSSCLHHEDQFVVIVVVVSHEEHEDMPLSW